MWGPYHCRRLEVFRHHARARGHEVVGISLFSGSAAYQWSPPDLPDGVLQVDLGCDETRLPVRHLGTLLSLPGRLCADVALLPSYGHWSLVLNLGVRIAGGRVVMMNDTHAGTARARGLKAALKRRVVASFHSAFVAGEPQRRYFASLGLPNERIFTGYDVVDNDYFGRQAASARSQRDEVRKRYNLPERYFLSLGRFVAKKNLTTLIRAYRKFLDANSAAEMHLVMVGAGEEDVSLRALCSELGLPVYEKSNFKGPTNGTVNDTNHLKRSKPGVHFYGFMQINENPNFYALADTFILPSLYEEWGLVVNEAMACGLPVVVSRTAGCAEDLLELPASTSTFFPLIDSLAGVTQENLRSNGFVFDPESSDQLAAALALLNAKQDLRSAMGEASKRVVDKFSCESFAKNALLAVQAAMDVHPGRTQN